MKGLENLSYQIAIALIAMGIIVAIGIAVIGLMNRLLGKGITSALLFAMIAGTILTSGLYGTPEPIKKTWHKISETEPGNKSTEEAQREAKKIIHEFETSYRPSADCINPLKELKKLECKNQRDMAFQSYAKQRIRQIKQK